MPRMPNRVALALPFLLLAAGCGAQGPSSRPADDGGGQPAAARAEPPGEDGAPSGEAVGQLLPALSLPDLAGKTRPLRARPDEVTVLNFWATWCVPCLKELPELVALDHRWAERGVRVVGIAIDSGDPADIRAFAEGHGMDYTLLVADQQWAREHFGVFGLPVTLVVDRQGRIRRRMIGPQTGAQFQAAVRPLLAEGEETDGEQA
jgi:cytochrome c biogenesis protein CcmG/thiol:disulfide interchange protein DsbE